VGDAQPHLAAGVPLPDNLLEASKRSGEWKGIQKNLFSFPLNILAEKKKILIQHLIGRPHPKFQHAERYCP
jgi:hypothetical protein